MGVTSTVFGTKYHISFLTSASTSSAIACFHPGLNLASSYDYGSLTSLAIVATCVYLGLGVLIRVDLLEEFT